MEKNKLSKNSSLFVSTPALCLWLVLSIASAAFGYELMAGLFVFFLLFFSGMRYWTAKAMDGVSLELSCLKRCIYPGMDTEIEYTVKNEKLLPLMWLELSQKRPEKDCVLPDESFKFYSYLKDEADTVREISACKRDFSLVMGYETMRFASTWHAHCRGIYRPDELLLRSGDGFGLSQEEKAYPRELMPEIVVYPQKVPVDCGMFMRQDWDKSYGALGFKEDMSVLRGVRPYTGAESWKRINWRMAARQPGELNVNFYETVQPASIMFILDGESYCNDSSALESCLEIMASLITELCAKAISCGLCLPKSKHFDPVSISHERQASSAELLYYLAGYDCLMAPVPDANGNPSGKYYPSFFEVAALARNAMDAGTVALFTNDPSALSSELLGSLDSGRLFVFFTGKLDCPDNSIRLMAADVLRKGGRP